MYTSYSTLQRKQLSKQVYTDTQSTYLLVYAPGRHKALQAALQNQLHRKFRLVTRLEDELSPDVAGVLLVSEDVECTPTALTYFAAALREGADLAVCDASFGFDGSTALYLSTRHLPGSSCALVSRALLDKVRAAARGKDSVTELLRLAHAMAQHSRCIPQALKLFGLFCLPYLCIRFMGLSPLSFLQVQLLTSLMLFLSNALPNVAGMGSIETAFLLVFGSFLERGEVMSVMMLYRIASYYVVFAASAVGFFFAQRHLTDLEPPKED